MVDIQTRPPEIELEDQKPRRWPMYTILVAAAVILIVVAVAVFDGSEESAPIDLVDQPPAQEASSDAPAAPLDIAARFFEARNARDAAAIEDLFSATPTIVDLVYDPTGYARVVEFERAVGWDYTLGDCNEVEVASDSGPTHTRMTCFFTWENDWSRALGVEPLAGNWFTFEIADGEIVALDYLMSDTFVVRVRRPFRQWLEQNHPEDVERMIDPNGPVDFYPLMDPEAVALWERYTKEFVDDVGANG